MPKWRHRRLSGKKRALLLVLFLLAALLALAIVAMTHLKPVLTSLATARVSNTVNGIVTAAVNETIYSGGVDYDQLISFEKDNEGKITAVKSNMAEFNRLQSAIIDEVLEKLSEVTTKELSVPVGTLLGSPFLVGARAADPRADAVGRLVERAFEMRSRRRASTRRSTKFILWWTSTSAFSCRAFPQRQNSATPIPWRRPLSSAPCRTITPISAMARTWSRTRKITS